MIFLHQVTNALLVALAILVFDVHPAATGAEKQKPTVTRTISPDKLYEVREAADERDTVELAALHSRGLDGRPRSAARHCGR